MVRNRLRWVVLGPAIAVLGQLAAEASGAPGAPATAAVQLVHTKARANGTIALTVNVREAGQLTAVGLYGPGADRAGAASVGIPRPVPKVYASAMANPTAPGALMLKLKPNRRARATLRRKHRLKVYLTLVLLPSHGSAVTIRTAAHLKAHRRHRLTK